MQTNSLAKFHGPAIYNIVLRKRLFQRLEQARKKRIIWVTGQPGSGKTTLVASYISAHKLPHAWYYIDRSDLDLATFFYYLKLLVKEIDGKKSARLPALTPEYFQNIPIFAQRYFENIYQILPKGFVLVFDNYHLVNPNPLFHTIMYEALIRVPDHSNVVLVSRTEPPDTFSRLRANSMMEVVDHAMIKFTPEETGELIRLRSGESHTYDTVKRLYDLTDGWAAGIILMLEQYKDRLDVVSQGDFKDYQAIFDYFSAEIFDRLTPDMQDFLMKTSLFSYMTEDMANRITKRDDAESVLNGLVKSQYFTIKHQDNTYTYHDMFREFLMMRAKMYFTETELQHLYKQSAMILRENGKIEDAVELYKKAGSVKDIQDIIMEHAQVFIEQGRNKVLEAWIKSLPEDILNQDPWLLYWLGEAIAVFNPVEGRSYFEKSFKGFIIDTHNPYHTMHKKAFLSDGVYLSWCGIVETFFYEFGNYKRTEKWIFAMEKIIATYPKFPSKDLKARVLSLMVQLLTFQKSEHPKIKTWAEQALSLLEYIKNPNVRIYYLSYIANYYSWTGNIVKFDLLINIMKSIESPKFLSIKTRLLYNMFIAVHARHLSLKETCLNAVSESLAIADTYGVHCFDHLIMAQAVYLLFGTGDTAKIEEFLSMMGPKINQSSLLEVIQYTAMLGWLDKINGDIQNAKEKLQHSLKLSLKMGSPFPEALIRIALAEVCYMQCDYTMAAKHLNRALFLGKKMKSHMLEYLSSLLKISWFLDNNVFHNEEKGLKLLRMTMALGKKYDIINTFLETRRIRTLLCMKSLEEGIEVQYVHKLIKRLELIPDGSSMKFAQWPWAFKIYALGSFKILHDDAPIKLSKKAQLKPIELLQFLVVNHDKPVELDHISGVLWPDAPGDYAHQTLDTTIHRLRKLLGSNDAVIAEAGRLMLNPKMCWVDVQAFDYLFDSVNVFLEDKDRIPMHQLKGRLSKVRNGRKVQDIKQKAKDYQIKKLEQQIFTLYKGDFFSQESLPSWAISFRDSLHDRFIRFVEILGAYYRDSGDFNHAIQIYKKGLEIDNQVESFYQQLMMMYKYLGRCAEAATIYRRCKVILSQTLGIEPSDKTKEIYRDIKSPISIK